MYLSYTWVQQIMKDQQLIYVTDEEPGFRRKRWGKGFRYFAPGGEAIKTDEVPQRIEKLVIPPMWKEVWICKSPHGHLQATGRDEKGRKQYIYHELWQERQSRKKFDRLIEFASVLPTVRERLALDLKKSGWPKEKVLALVVSLLDETYVRIGNQEYAKQNSTYGLTTLRRRHLKEEGKQVMLTYRAKHGIQQRIPIESKRLRRLVRACSELPGYELFKYYPNGTSQAGEPIDSADVNQYLKELCEEEFTSKTFRTWGASVTAIAEFENACQQVEANPKKNLDTTLVRRVASRLGNTVAVCRSHYIHPCILECVEDGYLKRSISRFKTVDRGPFGLRPEEQITLKLLKRQRDEMPEIQIKNKKSA